MHNRSLNQISSHRNMLEQRLSLTDAPYLETFVHFNSRTRWLPQLVKATHHTDSRKPRV